MKKLTLSFALAGILGAKLLADVSGAFIGIGGAYGAADTRFEAANYSQSLHFKGFRYGFIAGYKQLHAYEFGSRFYLAADFGTDYKKGEAKMSSYNINANADGLYNFISGDNFNLGAFAGWSLGYANHTFKAPNIKDIKVGGFDLGFNFGFGISFASSHAIEIYSRYSLLNQKKDFSELGTTYTSKVHQPYTVGLRYVFHF